MKLKTLAVAAAMLSASAVGSMAATFTTSSSTVTGGSAILAAYYSWADSWSSVFEGIYGVNSYGSDWGVSSFGTYSAKVFGSTTVLPRTSAILSTDFDAVNFRIVGTGNTATATFDNYIATVPGPEAGAGLGALAMGGVAYLVARRRKEVATA